MQTRTTEARIINFCNWAPRTWDEIVSCIAGCTASRGDLPAEDEQKVTEASFALGEMVRAGTMTREYASDPREDLFCPMRI